MNCKHYFGRTVKSLEGIPYDYEHGCMANHNLDVCGDDCPYYDPKEYRPTSIGCSPIDDLKRFMDEQREIGYEFREIRMPVYFYAKLTPEQIRWAEEQYDCKITSYEPIVYKTSFSRTSETITLKSSSPKEYGMSLMKRKRR